MNQLLKNFIPLGDTGSICYMLDCLRDLESKDNTLIQSCIKNIKTKKIQKVILLKSLTKKVDYDSISKLLTSNNFPPFVFTANLEFQKQVELLESILDKNKESNIGILYFGISPALTELTIKLLLYMDQTTSVEDVYFYLSNEEPDIITLNEFKKFQNFLESDSYLITKPDREFRKTSPKLTEKIETKSALSATMPASTTAFTLNLSSLNLATTHNEPLLTETEAINFNLNSLIESDFRKEESAEEHYQKIKDTAMSVVDDSLSLDVDLSEEIEYISSLENLSTSTMDKISIANIETIPLDNTDLPKKTLTPTIDYKTKDYLDFDAIINEEIERGMNSDGFDSDFAMDFNDIGIEEKGKSSFVSEESAINLDSIQTQANIDLSFPAPLQDLEDLLDEEMDLEHESIGISEEPVDPSQTFMVKRINNVIQNEVLNEDSKGKIPVSNLIKVNTGTAEAIPLNTNPTTPKISSPRFNPITLDD